MNAPDKSKIDPLEESTNETIAELVRERRFEWEVLYPKNEQGIGNPASSEEWLLVDHWEALGKTLQSDEDIDRALARNVCRCGTYQRIRAAIRSAAEEGGR